MLYGFYANAPERIQHINNVKNLQIKFADQIRNCEDLALDPHEGFAILSCDPGRDTWNTVMVKCGSFHKCRKFSMLMMLQGHFSNPIPPPETGLYLWDYDDPDSIPEKLKLERFAHKEKKLHPLGIDYLHNGRKLLVVNHDEDGPSIEIFKLSAVDRKLSHVRTMSHDLLATPNSVAAYNGSQFFATNDHHFKRGENPKLAMLETYLTLPGGTLVHGDRPAQFKRQPEGLDVKVMDRLPFANGIAFLNSTTLAVASTGRQQVHLYHVQSSADTDDTHPELTRIHTIQLPFLVDNLKSDKRGTLFLAGHPHAPTTELVASNAAKCASPSKEGCKKDVKGLSWISEWSAKQGLKHLYVGDEYPTSSAAVRDRDRGIGIAVGLYAKGVLVWEDAEPEA